jgi:hypothetical protein
VKVGGTATGASCFSPATPCGKLFPDAVNAGATVVQGVNPVTLAVADAGPYPGGALTYSSQRGGSLSSSNRGYPPFEIVGMGAPVVITEDPVTHCVICISNGTSAELVNVDLQKGTNGGFMLLVAGYSQVILENSILDSFTNNVAPEGMIDAEIFGTVQIVGSLTVNGATAFMAEGEDNGQLLLLDSSTVITCGPNYSNSQSFYFLNHSILDSEADIPVTYSGCPTSGVGLQANGSSQWKRNNANDNMPGNTFRVNSADTIVPIVYTPNLTACTNGALRSGSSNYRGWIEFTGNTTICTLNFGKPASYTQYFFEQPACVFGGAVPVTPFPSDNEVELNGTFSNGVNVEYICEPFGN